MELRRVIEVAAARFAAQRRTDDDIARLDREIAILENAGNDLDQRVEADMRFHQAIAVASGNPLFVLVLEKLHETMTDFLKLAHVRSFYRLGVRSENTSAGAYKWPRFRRP